MNKLKEYDVPLADLKFMVERLFGVNFYDYITKAAILNVAQQRLLEFVIKEYNKGRPLEYILGESNFLGLYLDIDESVLIPRPETEILIEQVLKFTPLDGEHLTGFTKKRHGLCALDVGTGSGNISIALSLYRPSFRVFSVDISKDALSVARANALKYSVENLYFVNADCFNSFKEKVFDIIISNPPYVDTLYLDKNKGLQCEPRVALDGGSDGLILIKRILSLAKLYLKKEGLVFLEIGYNQKRKVINYASGKRWELLSVARDYSGVERVVIFRHKN